MPHQYVALEETVYFGFAANLTTGAAGDGATPLFDVRLAGAAASAAPVLSGTPTLLTHANYTDGLHEIAIAATAANGFAAGNTYLVFATLTIDSVTPAAFVGSFRIAPVPANVTQWLGSAAATPTVAGVPEVDVTHLLGTAWLAPGTAGTPDVNVKLISGDATAADNLETAADGGSYNLGGGGVVAASVAGAVGSVTGAVGSVTGAVGSVTGNVGGNVVGSVASVTAGVTLAAAAVQAIWDALTSALTTVGSIGKLIVDNLNATISSRLASASYTAPLDAAGTRTAVGLASANLDTQLGDLPTAAENADAVWDEDATAHQTLGTFGQAIGDPVADANTIFGAVVTGAAGATIAADIIAVKADTDDIGAAGAGLTAVPWNAAWDAEVQSEATDALNAYDPPTNAEMEARTLAAASYATVAGLLAGVIEGAVTLKQSLQLANAANAGKVSGAATSTVLIRDLGDTKNRLSATVDADGNRSAVTPSYD